MFEEIKKAAQQVMSELNCTEIEAITKMQATAAKSKNEEVLEKLCEYKWSLIDA